MYNEKKGWSEKEYLKKGGLGQSLRVSKRGGGWTPHRNYVKRSDPCRATHMTQRSNPICIHDVTRVVTSHFHFC